MSNRSRDPRNLYAEVLQIAKKLQEESPDKPFPSKQIHSEHVRIHKDKGDHVTDRHLRRFIQEAVYRKEIVPVKEQCARAYWLPEYYRKHEKMIREKRKRERDVEWQKKITKGVVYFGNKRIETLLHERRKQEQRCADCWWEIEKGKILEKERKLEFREHAEMLVGYGLSSLEIIDALIFQKWPDGFLVRAKNGYKFPPKSKKWRSHKEAKQA